MSDVRLLDCTLRDGGYVNDWKFGEKNLNSIFERLVDSNVDIIEIGFLDDRRPFDKNRSIMPNSACAGKIFGKLDSKQAMVVGMIDYGTCDIKNIQSCEESFLDGIRVIFKKHLMHEAMAYCAELKRLGYKVFSQLVSITSYNDEELRELIALVNEVKPYAVSMVDTYGLLHPDDLLHFYNILDEEVDLEVQIGFHAHNNFQLAYANALAFIEKEGKHNIVVDGTLYGMGKSAGNAPLELIAMRLNDKLDKKYNIQPMLVAIEESVMEFYYKAPWGYNLFFYLSAKNRCHPNYLTYYNAKQNLSYEKIDVILSRIEPEDKKLLYDKLVAEQLYQDYLGENKYDENGRKNFVEEVGNRKILLLGPGKTIEQQENEICKFIDTENPYIISINFLPNNYKVDCVFVTNPKRYHAMAMELRDSSAKILATTNVEGRNGEFDFVINRAPLLEVNEKIIDNSFLMFLKFAEEIGKDSIYCAGFDGYSEKGNNYYDHSMEYYFGGEESECLNSHVKDSISTLRKKMSILFITYSAYEAEEDIHGAAF